MTVAKVDPVLDDLAFCSSPGRQGKPTDPPCHSAHAPYTQSLGDHDVGEDSTCTTSLPRWIKATKSFANKTSAQRQRVMDVFCGTPCGQTYTRQIVAEQLGCSSIGEGRASVTANRSVIGRLRSSYASEVQRVPRFDLRRTLWGSSTRMDAPSQPSLSNSTTTNLDEEGDEVTADFPASYPGLELGCIKDSDNVYCALLKGDLDNGDCEFYRCVWPGAACNPPPFGYEWWECGS